MDWAALYVPIGTWSAVQLIRAALPPLGVEALRLRIAVLIDVVGTAECHSGASRSSSDSRRGIGQQGIPRWVALFLHPWFHDSVLQCLDSIAKLTYIFLGGGAAADGRHQRPFARARSFRAQLVDHLLCCVGSAIGVAWCARFLRVSALDDAARCSSLSKRNRLWSYLSCWMDSQAARFYRGSWAEWRPDSASASSAQRVGSDGALAWCGGASFVAALGGYRFAIHGDTRGCVLLVPHLIQRAAVLWTKRRMIVDELQHASSSSLWIARLLVDHDAWDGLDDRAMEELRCWVELFSFATGFCVGAGVIALQYLVAGRAAVRAARERHARVGAVTVGG